MSETHRGEIVDQFTRQACGFSQAPGIVDAAALRLLVECSGANADDTVLDVACGPGVVACAFAQVARHVTGIDITPAMLDLARARQQALGLVNLDWQNGDVLPLPFGDAAFSLAVSRFAFHHFLDPAAVLREMVRVTRAGGAVVVVDSAPAPDKADAFNAMEKLRDPSHVRAMPLEELRSLMIDAGLPPPRVATYRLEGELEGLLGRSFPRAEDAALLRRMFEASLADDSLDIAARRDGSTIRYGYPVAILASRKAAHD
jgi:SAM-dependent methyltransferase